MPTFDLAAVGQAFRRCNALGIVHFDALRFHELEKMLAIAAHVALDFCQRRQLFAFGLGHVENVNGTKSVELS